MTTWDWGSRDVFLARFEAYVGRSDGPCVPRSLRNESPWDQKRGKMGPKFGFLLPSGDYRTKD